MSYKPSRNVFLLGLVSFFNDLSAEMVISVFPAFFVSVLKSGAASLGLVEGIADGVANIIKIYSGRLSDYINKRKPFMMVGYAFSVFTRPVYMLVTHIYGVVGLRLVDRVGKGLREAPRDAILSLSTPPEQIGRAFGFHRAMDTLGGITGPLAAYFILETYPGAFDKVFLSAFVIGLLAIVSIFFVRDVVNGFHSNKKLAFGNLSMYSTDFKQYLLALFLLSVGSMPVVVLLLKTQGIGTLTIASIPLFYMLYNLSYAGFSIPAGRLSDRWGAKSVIRLGYLVLLGSYVFLAYANTIPLLIVGFLLLGFFPALTDGVQRALASDLSEPEYRAGALGLVNAVSGLGLLVAGIGGGYLWQHDGVNVALSLASLFVLLGIAMLSFVIPRQGTEPNR
jgi:MFS family permease